MTSKIIKFDDPSAAVQYEQKVWQSVNGKLFINEDDARNDSCTYRLCKSCNALTDKIYTICGSCRDKAEHERYLKFEEQEWDLTGMVYSQITDEYYTFDDLSDYCIETGTRSIDMQLLICDEVGFDLVSDNFWDDQLLGDKEIPEIMSSALELLNMVILTVSSGLYEPSNIRVKAIEDF